jgi:hypothetical protein
MTLEQLTRSVQGQILDALDRPAPPDPHVSPPVSFNLDPFPQIPPLGDGLELRIDLPDRTSGPLPFAAQLWPVNDGSLAVAFDAAPSLYDLGAVEAWLDAYVELLPALPGVGPVTV